MRTFSPEKLKERRQAFKLSQAELAKITGLSVTYINYLERGKRKPGADVIARLAWCLRIKEGYFFIDTPGSEPIKRERRASETGIAS